MRVLFVDDEQGALDGLRRALRRIPGDWDMSFYATASAALESLSQRDVEPVLIVTDWRMPGINGMDLCRTLRRFEAEDPERRFYTILLSGVHEIDSVVEALDQGADDFVRKPCDPRELAARIRVGARILSDEHALREANRRLESLASVDSLTGLLNRRKTEEILRGEMSRVERNIQGLGVMLLDIDHFKIFNDSHGHAAGDDVLAAVAARLVSESRPYDSVGRWGGEEFLVMCPNVEAGNVPSIAERMRAAVCENEVALRDGRVLAVSVSVGAAYVAKGSRDRSDAVIQRADEQLYAAKRSGRNCVKMQSAAALRDEPGPRIEEARR